MRKYCDSCGAEFDSKRPAGKYCSDRCRKRHQRNPDLSPAPRPADPAETDAEPAQGPVMTSTLERLHAAGVGGEPVAQACLALARRIDQSMTETGSAVASLVREYRASLGDALGGAEQAVDPVDELRSRRERRNVG